MSSRFGWGGVAAESGAIEAGLAIDEDFDAAGEAWCRFGVSQDGGGGEVVEVWGGRRHGGRQ